MLDLKVGDKVKCTTDCLYSFSKNKIYIIEDFDLNRDAKMFSDLGNLVPIRLFESNWELVTDNIKKGPFERDPVPENAWDISNIDVPDFEKLAETFNKNQYEFIASLKTKSKT